MSAPRTGSYADYLNLFANRALALEHADILLFPDRALGPSGEQALMDLRSDPRTSAHPWPSPGVYNTSRLISALAKNTPQQSSLSRLQTLAVWLELWPQKSLAMVSEIWPRVNSLLAHSVSSTQWYQICQEAVQNDDPEVSEWMPAMLMAMQWCLYCEEKNIAGSPWQQIAHATAQISQLNSDTLAVVCERSPWLMDAQKLRFHIPVLRGAYPIEANLFLAIEQNPHCEVIYYSGASVTHDTPTLAAIAPQPAGDVPSALVIVGKLRTLPYTLLESELAKWPLFIPSITEAPLKEEIASLKFLEREVSENDDNLATYLQLREIHDLLQARRSPVNSADMLAAADFCGLLTTNVASETVHPQWSPRGVPCISLDDAWALPRQSLCVVSSDEDFRDPWDPLSKLTRGKTPLPHGVQNLLHGFQLLSPQASEEALWSRNFFHARAADFTRWESPSNARPALGTTPPTPQLSEDAERRLAVLSPSGIEALLRCPYEFYDQRLRRCQESAEQDALTINALRKGEWLHKALEVFFDQPDFVGDPIPKLSQTLLANIDKYFSDIASADYLSALQRRVPKFATDLAIYLNRIEQPLHAVWPERRFLRETNLNMTLGGLQLRGKVDRIDEISGGRALLWDYKSGGNFNLGLKTLLGPTHRKVQWLTYAKMIESHLGLRIVGGGYGQITVPDQSGIFLFAEHLHNTELAELSAAFGASDLPIKIIKASDEASAVSELAAALEIAKAVVETRDFERRPLKDSQCETCPSRVACGKPYFASEESSL